MEGYFHGLNTWVGWIGGAIVLIAILLVFIQCCHYRLGRHEFEILFAGKVIRKVPLKEIEAVRVGGSFPCEFWPARDAWSGGRLTIRRRRGLFRHVTITPKNPDQLRINLYYALGWKP